MEYDAPGRIIGIDDDERARCRRDEAAQVIEVRHPPAIGIGAIEQRSRAELGDHGRVKRVGRHRHQHVGVFVHERAEDELDAFRCTGREKRAIGRHRKTARRVLRGDRLASRGDARRGAVAIVSVAQRPLDRSDEVRRRFEPEGHRIADIQVADAPAAGLDPVRLRDDITNGVRKPAETGGDGNWRGDSRGSHAPSYRECNRVIITLGTEPPENVQTRVIFTRTRLPNR